MMHISKICPQSFSFNSTYHLQLPISYDTYIKTFPMETPRILFAGSQSEKCFGDGHVKAMSGILDLWRKRKSINILVYIIFTCKTGSQ